MSETASRLTALSLSVAHLPAGALLICRTGSPPGRTRRPSTTWTGLSTFLREHCELDDEWSIRPTGTAASTLRDVRDMRERFEQPFRLVVVGEFDAGRSALINALLGLPDALPDGVVPPPAPSLRPAHPGGERTAAPGAIWGRPRAETGSTGTRRIRVGESISPFVNEVIMPSMGDAAPDDVLGRLARIDTSSLVDAGRGLRVLPAALRPVRRGLRLAGRALTVDAREDLMPMFAGLRLSGPGDVLVVAGNDTHAVVGELMATEALRRGVAGIVVDGVCRDSRVLAEIDLPVYARGVAPTACQAMAVPVVQVSITIGTVPVHPGDLLVGDDDGIVVASEDEIRAILDAAEAIQRREDTLRTAIAAGASLFDGLNYDEHLAAVQAGRNSSLTFF